MEVGEIAVGQARTRSAQGGQNSPAEGIDISRSNGESPPKVKPLPPAPLKTAAHKCCNDRVLDLLDDMIRALETAEAAMNFIYAESDICTPSLDLVFGPFRADKRVALENARRLRAQDLI